MDFQNQCGLKDKMKLNGSERILIIKPSSLGDIIHALPLLHELKTKFPSLKVSWLINKEYAPLLENHPLIESLYLFDRHKWGKTRNVITTCREYWQLVKKIRAAQFDIIIDLQGLLRSGVTSYLSGSVIRIGLSDAREGSSFFYTERIRVHDKKRHAVDRYKMIGSLLGIPSGQPVKFPLKFLEEDVNMITDFLSKNSLSTSELVIAVNPNARWASKRWPAEKFGQLSDILIEKFNGRIVFVGAPSEKDYVESIIKGMRNKAVNAAGITTLPSLGVLLRKVHLFITNDSGPMHVGVAVDVPIVALFGPTDPEKTGPYGINNKTIYENGCVCRNPRRCKQPACMEKISVQQAASVCETVLKQRARKIMLDNVGK